MKKTLIVLTLTLIVGCETLQGIDFGRVAEGFNAAASVYEVFDAARADESPATPSLRSDILVSARIGLSYYVRNADTAGSNSDLVDRAHNLSKEHYLVTYGRDFDADLLNLLGLDSDEQDKVQEIYENILALESAHAQ